ncbi:hypothetical protein [Nocardioides jensenii]|uniref:hypothetical protein n=1 Tax=Nocardioides jensenii TaxID=1843 RepID=UPI0008351627|nr:hypothetical protein [Nocardioides jensenii]
MKLLSGLVAAFLLVTGISFVGGAANADPYTPSINTFADAKPIKAPKHVARIRLAIATNGFGVPDTRTQVIIRNAQGKIVFNRFRYTTERFTRLGFRLKKGKYTISLIVSPRGKFAARYSTTTERTRVTVR